MSNLNLDIDPLRQRIDELPNNALLASRRAALSRLASNRLPDTRDEDWRYTGLSTAIEISNRALQNAQPDGESAVLERAIDAAKAAYANLDAAWLVIANGALRSESFDAPDGVAVERFSDSGVPRPLERPLADLNAALLVDGLRIRIDSNQHRPIGLLVVDSCQEGAGSSQIHVEFDIAENVQASVLHQQLSVGTGDHYANEIVTLNIGRGAIARVVRLQQRADAHVQTARCIAHIDRDASLHMTGIDLGGRLVRNDIELDLRASGANAELDGVFVVGHGQHIDNHTRIDHRTGPTTSQQEYRGVLAGRSRGVWNGKAIVHDGADGTDATQANHNLLLTEQAEIDAKPELEIYTDDVKCSHGTTIGQLDEQALFYLRSRGIGRDDAKRILTHAFAAGLVARLPIPALRDSIDEQVSARIDQLVSGAVA